MILKSNRLYKRWLFTDWHEKQFETVVDEQATSIDSLYISGGERGIQIEMAVDDLVEVTNAKVMHVTHH